MTISKLELGVRAGIARGPKPAAELRLSVSFSSADLGKTFEPSLMVTCPCTSDSAVKVLSMLRSYEVRC